MSRSAAIGAAVGGDAEPSPPENADIAGLRERLSALRGSAERPGRGLRPTLDAILAELDVTLGLVAALRPAAGPGETDRTDRAESTDAERRLLRAVFQEVPAPIFLLARDGTVRRVNRQAAALLGTDSGSASGKPFTALIHLHDRAAVKKQLAALLRTRRPRRLRCTLLSASGPLETTATADLVRRPGESEPLITVVLGSAITPVPPATDAGAANTATADKAIAAVTQRLDLMSAATRLLLENAAFSESVMLRRCAALLASELSAWVLVDVEQDGALRRMFVAGPAGEHHPELIRAIEDRDPLPGSLPWEVHHTGLSRLLADAPQAGVLGTASSGVPVLRLLGATTVLCAPLTGERSYGTITLARRPDVRPFTTADVDLVEDIAQHVAVAIKVGRMFLRRSAVTDALQASLLPRELPQIPGVEIAASYVPASEDLGVGGDFYDVYPSAGSWGLAIGDVRGKGEEAAAATAMARYAIRVFAHWNADPADVLRLANEYINSQEPGGEQFVTAVTARLEWNGGTLRVQLASTGHPAPLLVRPDGRVRKLSGGGLPIGFLDDARPAAEHLDLEPGDLLFLYSDGVTEASNAGGAYFESQLADELASTAGRPAGDVVSAVRDRVLEFSDNSLRDDMSMVVLRVLGLPDELPGNHGHPAEVQGTRPGNGDPPAPADGRRPGEGAAWK